MYCSDSRRGEGGINISNGLLTNDKINLAHLPYILSLLYLIKKESLFIKSIYDDRGKKFVLIFEYKKPAKLTGFKI